MVVAGEIEATRHVSRGTARPGLLVARVTVTFDVEEDPGVEIDHIMVDSWGHGDTVRVAARSAIERVRAANEQREAWGMTLAGTINRMHADWMRRDARIAQFRMSNATWAALVREFEDIGAIWVKDADPRYSVPAYCGIPVAMDDAVPPGKVRCDDELARLAWKRSTWEDIDIDAVQFKRPSPGQTPLTASIGAAIDECDAYGEAQQKQIATAAAELRKLLVTHGSVVTSSTPPPKSGVALVFQYELQQETDRARRDPSYVPPMCTNPPPPPWPSVGDTWTDAHTYRRWQYAGSLRGWVEEQGAAYTVAPTPLTPSWMKIGDTYYGITPDGQWGIVDAPETNPQQSATSEGKSSLAMECSCGKKLDERDLTKDRKHVTCYWCGCKTPVKK
jgi:hypothetical protein